MKKLFCLLVLSSCMFLEASSSVTAMVTGGVWYDNQEMAVAIDLSHPDWEKFNRLELDFNADREWGQIIDGSEWLNIDNQSVRRFEFGVYHYHQNPDVRYFGWSHNPLLENESRSDWSVYVNQLYYGEKSPESLQCYTPEWVPDSSTKIVYCRQLDPAGNSIPVLLGDLDDVYLRYPDSDWIPLSSFREPHPPLTLSMQIAPNVLNLGSKGQFVSVKISLPNDIDADAIDMDMTILFSVNDPVDNTPVEVHVEPVKWITADGRSKNGVKHLIFKVAREELTRSLPPGEAKIVLKGSMTSGERLNAEGTITLR